MKKENIGYSPDIKVTPAKTVVDRPETYKFNRFTKDGTKRGVPRKRQ